MAKGIVETALTMNPIEVSDLQSFIIENVLTRPELLALHGIKTGVKMKEQIAFATQFGKTGLKGDSTCDRKTSGVSSTLSEKFWEPVGIEDTFIHCNAEIDGLFKAYFGKINKYRDIYEIEGSDLEIFFSILFLESMQKTIYRAAWFADEDVVEAAAAVTGVVTAADTVYYDYFDGIFKQIYTAVAASTIEHISITENAVVTSKAAQLILTTDAAVGYFDSVKAAASSALRTDPDAQLYVSRELFDNYKKTLTTAGTVYDINILQNGLQAIAWDNYNIVNMENVWGADYREDFVNNTTDEVHDLPHRIVFTTPENIPIGTLNQDDLSAIDVRYDWVSKKLYMEYGFTLDSKVLVEDMIVVAY